MRSYCSKGKRPTTHLATNQSGVSAVSVQLATSRLSVFDVRKAEVKTTVGQGGTLKAVGFSFPHRIPFFNYSKIPGHMYVLK